RQTDRARNLHAGGAAAAAHRSHRRFRRRVCTSTGRARPRSHPVRVLALARSLLMMPERRTEPRFLCSDLVKLRWRGARNDHSETVVLENISASGASVQSETSILEGTEVRMTCGKREFRGIVRSCYWRDDGYLVGIAFDAGSKWSR